MLPVSKDYPSIVRVKCYLFLRIVHPLSPPFSLKLIYVDSYINDENKFKFPVAPLTEYKKFERVIFC